VFPLIFLELLKIYYFAVLKNIICVLFLLFENLHSFS